MSKEKNKNTFRIGALLLVACLISSVMLSGTFAKYTSEYAGKDTALVATWDFVAEGGQDGLDLVTLGDAAVPLDLFKHAYNENILATAGAGKIIAPGVSGNFVLDLTNNSDVAADITFVVSKAEGSVNVPMEFSIGTDFDSVDPVPTIYDTVETLTTALNGKNIHLNEAGGESSVTVYWRWAYYGPSATAEATDTTDTVLGTTSASGDSRSTYTLNVKVTATQSEPGI